MIGQTIGNCRLESLVGSGGMGVVYRGIHLSLGVPVAVKLIKQEYAGDQDLIARFQREAQLAARLRHPNLVRVFDVGKDGDHNYIVMEYLEGPSMESFLEKHAPIESKVFFKLFFALAQALGEAHKGGIIHRDVKPENVILVEGHKPVLTDFGIAGILASSSTLTQPGHLLGTPVYMSPEQARGEANLDSRTDVFALGVMMFEALTGRLPQFSPNIMEQISRRASEALPSVHAVNLEIPDPLARVVDAALSMDSARRWASGQKLAEALTEAYRQIFSSQTQTGAGTVTAAPTEIAPAVERALKIPNEGTRTIADGVDIKYTDLYSILLAGEKSQTGFAMLQLHYPSLTDLLFFSRGALRMAYRWTKGEFTRIDFDEAMEQYEGADRGILDAMAISEPYYRALKSVLTTNPAMCGMKSGFVDFNKLLDHIEREGKSGVLQFGLSGSMGLIAFRDGTAQHSWLGPLVTGDTAQDPRRLHGALAKNPNVDIQVFVHETGSMVTGDAVPADSPLDNAALLVLAEFLDEVLSISGKSLHKAFGLGTMPVLEMSLRQTAIEFPVIFGELDLRPTFSIDMSLFVAQVDQLPQTGRRHHVLQAVRSLITGRVKAITEALPNERKRKKSMKELDDIWARGRNKLAEVRIADDLEPAFGAL